REGEKRRRITEYGNVIPATIAKAGRHIKDFVARQEVKTRIPLRKTMLARAVHGYRAEIICRFRIHLHNRVPAAAAGDQHAAGVGSGPFIRHRHRGRIPTLLGHVPRGAGPFLSWRIEFPGLDRSGISGIEPSTTYGQQPAVRKKRMTATYDVGDKSGLGRGQARNFRRYFI